MALSLWQRYLRWRLRNVEVVACDESGLTHDYQRKRTFLRWDEVEKIHAFKRDLMTIDCLCLAFTTKNGILEISEDARGYAPVLEQIEHHFAIAPEWRMAVLFPPFEMNLTQIYPEASAS